MVYLFPIKYHIQLATFNRLYLNRLSFQLFHLMEGFSFQNFPDTMKRWRGCKLCWADFFFTGSGGWMRRKNFYHSTLL